MSKVNDTVFDFARVKAAGRELNDYHILFGYAQLISLNEEMLNSLFPTLAEKQELDRIRQVIHEEELDMDMLKKGLSLLLSQKVKKPEGGSICTADRDLAQIPADELLSELLDVNDTVVRTFKKGCTLTDAINWKNQMVSCETEDAESVSEEMKESAEDGTPGVELGRTVTKPDQQNKSLEELTLKAKDLYYSLRQNVIGQDDAIECFVRGFFKSEMFSEQLKETKRPSAVFLFAGPPGVGKTLLATKAAENLARPCLKLNMSEYTDPQSTLNLIGVSRKFAQGSEGKLTAFVQKNPNAAIIFDEFEKAHLAVMQLFLQILDGGLLEDSFTEKNVSFKDTILIFTTNAGKALYEDNQSTNLSRLDPTVVLDALQKEEHPVRMGPLLPAAICSRFTAGNVIMFNHLGARHLQDIVKRNLNRCAYLLEKKNGWKIGYDDRLAALFLYYQGANLDARIISSQSFQFIQDEIYEYARQVVERDCMDNIERVEFRINMEEASNEIRSMFVNDSRPEIILFGETNPTSEGYREITGDVVVHRVSSEESLKKVLTENDISFVVIDPDYGGLVNTNSAFSLDDMKTTGIEAFHSIRRELPSLSLYMLDPDQRLNDIDRITFMKQGVSGFFRYQISDPACIESELKELIANNYLQEKINELSGKGKHLTFNTAQKLSKDRKNAIIEFYDFHLYTAINAQDRSVILDSTQKPDVTFDDVIGAENAKDELKFYVGFMKNPRKYVLNGRRPPRGILLYGPPGTGKTMLAKALAGEADATFLAVNATDFMNKWVGEGENRIRNLFTAARKYAPSIIFIDEIDAIAKERTGESHTETYLNTLMTEMDGFKFDVQRPVIVIAATNFALDRSKANGTAVIDPALVRRFDNKILVDLPNKEERESFITRLLNTIKDHQVNADVIKNIADRTTGESLANIQNVINLARRNAEKKGESLSDQILLDAMEEYFYGEKREWTREYYDSVAHHEAGHAYISYLSGNRPSFITIVSRGDFGGYMQNANAEDIPQYTKEDLLWRIRVALAGRASEIVFFGEEKGTNTGVSGDLQTATNLALNMLCRYGMGENTLLSVSLDNAMHSPYSEQIMKQAEEILQTEMKNTIQLVEEGREKVALLSETLLNRNQLVEEEIMDILECGIH